MNGYEDHERLHGENEHLRGMVKKLQAVVDAARAECNKLKERGEQQNKYTEAQRAHAIALITAADVILRALDGEVK